MKNEKETTGATGSQGSGRRTAATARTTGATATTGGNMNPEAEGLHGWANETSQSTNRNSDNRTIGSRISTQYNNHTPTQKVVGATLLAASAVGTAYLTRNLWGKKNSWTGSAQTSRRDQNTSGRYGTGQTSGSQRQPVSGRSSEMNDRGSSYQSAGNQGMGNQQDSEMGNATSRRPSGSTGSEMTM